MASTAAPAGGGGSALIFDRPAVRSFLRIATSAAAAAGLLLNGLNVRRLLWLWTSRATEAEAVLTVWRFVPAVLQGLAFGIGFAVLGLVIVWRVGDRYEVLFGALFAATYSLSGGVAHAGPLAGEAWFPAVVVVTGAFARAVGVRFAALFPRPLRREDLVAAAPGWAPRSATRLLAALLDPRVYWSAALTFEGLMSVLPRSPARSDVQILLWCVLASIYLYTGYRRGGERERQRIFWILEGVVLFVAAEMLLLAVWGVDRSGMVALDLPVWTSLISAVTLWAVLACFYFAVFGAGALDSSLVLRRTTVISLSSAAVVLIFITLETLTEQVLAQVLGLQSDAGAVIAGVLAAATFHPLSGWIERHMHRWGGAAGTGRAGAD